MTSEEDDGADYEEDDIRARKYHYNPLFPPYSAPSYGVYVSGFLDTCHQLYESAFLYFMLFSSSLNVFTAIYIVLWSP